MLNTILSVTPAGANETIVASYQADISGLGGGSAVVFASGFLNPANNQNGSAFGLFAALADGTVVEFPAVSCPGHPYTRPVAKVLNKEHIFCTICVLVSNQSGWNGRVDQIS